MSRDLGLCLAGGGQRAFVQVGFLERWWPALEPRVGAISACSAGACFGVIWLTGRQPATHQYWLGRRDGITRNFHWGRLRRGGRLTPHIPIYPDTLRYALADGGFERIRALPFPFYVLAAALPPRLPVSLAVTLGMAGYSFERQLSHGKLHPKAGHRIGFTPFVLDARECADPEELVALVLASSATPPFTPLGAVRGQVLLDGGMVDNAPAYLAEGVPGVDRTLVLLTRPYPRENIGWQGRRLYLAPTEPPPISRWDYTSVERVEATLDLGRRDAERHGDLVVKLLEARGESRD
ncbi:MAG TPA: patatin-like phospholipase family protein [Gemmatimonadales bacterium]